jgi:hypothetical protein
MVSHKSFGPHQFTAISIAKERIGGSTSTVFVPIKKEQSAKGQVRPWFSTIEQHGLKLDCDGSHQGHQIRIRKK